MQILFQTGIFTFRAPESCDVVRESQFVWHDYRSSYHFCCVCTSWIFLTAPLTLSRSMFTWTKELTGDLSLPSTSKKLACEEYLRALSKLTSSSPACERGFMSASKLIELEYFADWGINWSCLATALYALTTVSKSARACSDSTSVAHTFDSTSSCCDLMALKASLCFWISLSCSGPIKRTN